MTSIHERFGEEGDPDWRDCEALKQLPILREVARIAQWEDTPLPTDEELLERARQIVGRFSSELEYRQGPQV